MKKVLSILLALVMLTSSLSNILVFAADTSIVSKITAESTYSFPGGTVDVEVTLSNNPGIYNLLMSFEYDSSAMNLIAVSNGTAMSDVASFTPPKNMASGCSASWYYIDEPDTYKDGSLAVLTFEVLETAKAGESYSVSVTNVTAEDVDGTECDISVENGKVSIIDYIPGDVNGDGKHTIRKDVSEFNQYIVDGCKYDPLGYAVQINENAGDVNDDNKINIRDVIQINKYIVDGCTYDPNGYAVKLLPHTPRCQHTSLIAIPAKEASCTEDGNKAYWVCDDCDKLFSDSAGTSEISNIIVAAKGHTEVVIPAVKPTDTEPGYTEGKKCSVCGTETVKPELVAPLNKYTITYHLTDNDAYLESNKDKIINPNRIFFTEEDEFELLDASFQGYEFDGWYNGSGAQATLVTKIEKNTAKNIDLYARWTIDKNSTYTVYFVSEGASCDVSYNGEIVSEITKFTNEKLVPPNPVMKGYIFLCWTDGDGNIVNSIEPGSHGEITLSAHWTSERNQTRPVKKLGNPIVIEDEPNGQIHFIYELGDIINVPLETLENYGNVDRLERESKTVSTKAISSTTAEKISETVAKVTSNSSSITLSEDWNENISVSEEQATNLSQENIDVISDRVENGGQWNISKSNGGTTEFSITTGESVSNTHKSTTATINESNMTLKANNETGFSGEFNIGSSSKASTETRQDFNIGLNGSIGKKAPSATGGLEMGLGLDVGYSKGRTTYNEETSHQDLTLGSYTKNGSEISVGGSSSTSSSTENSSENKQYTDLTSSNQSTWNSQEGYTQSRDDAHEESYTSAVSQAISDKLGYSTDNGHSNSESSTEQSVNQNENTNEYTSTVEYNTENREETMTSSKVYKDYAGYHRLVEAGTAHVFGIVSYDIATGAFYTSTYTKMDPETYPFYDYSKDGTYTDRENGILPFEIPFFVNKYVAANIAYTKGLEIDPQTGDVHCFDEEKTTENVMLPNYYSVDEGDGKRNFVKVSKFFSEAFKGNENIKTVLLSDYITEIPEGAFAGCTNLETVIAPSVTVIRKDAFKGCENLNKFIVSSDVEILEENAFENVHEIVVYASTVDVAKAAINSGAECISLYLEDMSGEISDCTIETGKNTSSFALYGAGKTLNNVKIVSNADTIILNKAKFNSYEGITLDLSASELTLNQVESSAKGVALLLRNPETAINLEQTSEFTSESGNSVVCNEISITKTTEYAAYFKVNGRMLVNGNVDFVGKNRVSPSDCIEEIDEDKYNAVISKINVAFVTDGGSTIKQQSIDYGTKVNEPTDPQKDHYSFLGWYTDEACTTSFNFDTPITSDTTLYAKWKLNEFNVTFNANGGNVSQTAKEVIYGEAYGTLPTPTRTGYTFNGWYTAANGGTKVTADTTVTATTDHTLYAQWTPNTFKVTYNANGGSVSPASKTLTFGDTYGTLPTPTRDYYTFDGWYTAASGGTKISSTTAINAAKDVTIYAHWTQNPVLGYVLASNMPTGAQVVARKYTYTLTEYTSSSSSTLSGWTHYDTTSVWSDYGAWSAWQDTAVSGSDSREVETDSKVIVTPGYYEYRYGRRQNSANSHWTFCTHAQWSGNSYTTKYSSWSKTRYSDCDDGKTDWTCSKCNKDFYTYQIGSNTYYWEESRYIEPIYKTQYRYRDRSLIYTYYFYKNSNLESASYPSGSNISNIQEWVQYREK